MGSIPGIDEASSFGAIMKSLDQYKFDLIIFDTAPTGHTLRLLDFPRILDKGIKKMIELTTISFQYYSRLFSLNLKK